MTETSVAWSWRHAFCSSDLPATTKHVLSVLGMFMNELGEGCYPSVADICRYSSLDKKTVLKHLAVARDAGWIAVSQHGYRGQKWKRNEYAARWPERDITAACQPIDDAEGGGAFPPPSEAEKAVESATQRGGPEGSKVVEEVHQDKTSPETPPDTSPVERGARASGQEAETETAASDGQPATQTREQLERRFWKLARDHPQSAGMPKQPWLKAWMNLSPEDRDLAERRYPGWLALLKAQSKSHVPALSTYFAERLFKDVPDPADEADKPQVLDARPFGPLWAALVVRELLGEPQAAPAPTSQFLADLVARDDEAGRAERLRRQAVYGWPTVNRWFSNAESRKGFAARPEEQPFAELTEPVPVDSDMMVAWKREFERRGWPWLPDWGGMRVVYLPKGGPDGLGEFEQALARIDAEKGEGKNGDDDG